jgi:hypothetical protein
MIAQHRQVPGRAQIARNLDLVMDASLNKVAPALQRTF